MTAAAAPEDVLEIYQESLENLAVITVRGALDIATAPSLRAALLEACETRDGDIVLNLADLTFLDSVGLGTLISAHRRANERGHNVRLVATNGPIERLLRITNLIGVFSVYSTLDDAAREQNRLETLGE